MKKNAIIIGGGTVAITMHLPRIQAVMGCEEVLIVESDVARREILARKFRLQRAVTVQESIPDKKMFSIAVIATPPKFHLEYFQKLRDRTRDIIIEKPMAMNVGQTQQIVQATRKDEPRVYVGLIRRALDGFAAIKKMYQSAQFGKLRKVEVAEGSVFSWNPASSGSFSRDLNGGGVLMDTGPHTIDLLFQVFDSLEVERSWVDADLRNGSEAIEANCVITMMADGDVPVTLNLSRNRIFSNAANFQFDKAVCTIGVRSAGIQVQMEVGVPLQHVPGSREMSPSTHKLFDLYYQRFVVTRNNAGVSPRDSDKIARIIDATYGKAELMRSGF